MGVITTEHLDDSELHDDELPYWGQRVRESLTTGYIARIEALHREGDYANDDAGWKQLKERAWSEALAADEVCKTISGLSIERRVERLLMSGSYLSAVPTEHITTAHVEAVLRAANPHGELTHLDGSPLTDDAVDQLAELANNPELRAAALQSCEGTYELTKAMSDFFARMSGRWAALVGQKSQGDAQGSQNHIAA